MSNGSSSGSSSVTDPGLCYRIIEIREATPAESAANNGGTLYIKRADEAFEVVSSVDHLKVYSFDETEILVTQDRPEDVWQAYNKIAKFILSGGIKLSGGKDCFKRLARPQPGVRTLDAGEGIFFRPSRDISTYGTIFAGHTITKVHLSAKEYDRMGRVRNKIKLLKNTRYFIRGDENDLRRRVVDLKPRWELLVCHRGRLREAGFEIPGPIDRIDLWLMNSEGIWKGYQPLAIGYPTCSNCLRSYANRQWPVIADVCQGKGHCQNAFNEMCASSQATWSCALAEVECAPYILRTYKGGRSYIKPKDVRDVPKALNASFTIRDWDHLSEITRFSVGTLCLLFCSMPSLGERLQKKGASFVPWASDSGICLGDYVEINVFELGRLYLALEDRVIDKHTGLKVKFEEDENGIVRVRQVEEGNDDFSDRLPVPIGPSEVVRLG